MNQYELSFDVILFFGIPIIPLLYAALKIYSFRLKSKSYNISLRIRLLDLYNNFKKKNNLNKHKLSYLFEKSTGLNCEYKEIKYLLEQPCSHQVITLVKKARPLIKYKKSKKCYVWRGPASIKFSLFRSINFYILLCAILAYLAIILASYMVTSEFSDGFKIIILCYSTLIGMLAIISFAFGEALDASKKLDDRYGLKVMLKSQLK